MMLYSVTSTLITSRGITDFSQVPHWFTVASLQFYCGTLHCFERGQSLPAHSHFPAARAGAFPSLQNVTYTVSARNRSCSIASPDSNSAHSNGIGEWRQPVGILSEHHQRPQRLVCAALLVQGQRLRPGGPGPQGHLLLEVRPKYLRPHCLQLRVSVGQQEAGLPGMARQLLRRAPQVLRSRRLRLQNQPQRHLLRPRQRR